MAEADKAEQARKKRRLRAPTETVREKAVKAQAAAAEPIQNRKSHKVWRIVGAPFRVLAWFTHKPPLKQVGHGLRWFFSRKPMRLIGIGLGFRYFYRSWQELKLVTWPSRKQSFRLTGAVIVFSVIFGALIAVVDFGLDKLFKQVILK